MKYNHFIDCQILRLDAPGNWILEAKVASYKLYTRSFLSLLMDKGWIADEVSQIYVYSLQFIAEHKIYCCRL